MTFNIRSYGVTLWYPTYIDRLSRENLESTVEHKDCNRTLSNYTTTSSNINSINRLFCACPTTSYNNVTFNNITVSSWWSTNSNLTNLMILGGRYDDIWYNDVVMDTVYYDDITFDDVHVINSTWRNVALINVTFINTHLCNIDTQNISFTSTIFTNSTFNNVSLDDLSSEDLSMLFNNDQSLVTSSCDERSAPPTNCIVPQTEVDLSKEYFYDFVIAGSAFPGNVISAIAVYFFRRSYWLGEMCNSC